jgi:hypothetical protein
VLNLNEFDSLEEVEAWIEADPEPCRSQMPTNGEDSF